MDEQQKDRIGDYELHGLIGDGAQGRVYKARRLPAVGQEGAADASEEFVALKVVRITGEDEKVRLKFQEQADILRRLSHPSIVAYRDCFAWHAGEWDESQCLAMELLEGESLHDRLIKSSSGMPWPQVEEIFEQCLAGLIHARERGITHRDIKPSNIFLTNDGRAKLIDFDIARRDDSGQMSTAGFKGTFDYMAPDFITIEGFRGDEVSDVFSIGVCFYQALTGSLPFERLGENAHIGYLNRWRDNANPTPSFRPGVFRVLANAKAVVSRCLTSRREQRYQTFAAMLEDFRKIRYRRVRHKNKDEYELLAVLGRGGFGEVFKARRVSDGMLVAVKYLFSEKQSDRFIKEAKILQQYSHPNLVKYVDFMVLDGAAGEKQFFLVMEFLEGMPGWTLRPRLKNEGKLEVDEAVKLFSAYLSALQFLHENPKPIIHRDIKPGNLYAPVGQPDKAKIFDLGVARDVTGTVTVGGVPGTLDYMAPEFAEAGGDRGSPQSDLYALGLCLYEALAGKPAYDRLPTDLNSAWITFQNRIRNPPPVDFDAAAFTQYPRLKQVVSTTLALRACDRYRSAADMRTALQAALNPEAMDQDGLDGLDDNVEVTMATFSPPCGPQAGPLPATAADPHLSAFQDELGAAGEPITSGTRAVAASDASAAVAAARDGARLSFQVLAAELPRLFNLHRKRFIIGGIAALLLVTLIIGIRALVSGSENRAGETVSLKLPSTAKPVPASQAAPVAAAQVAQTATPAAQTAAPIPSMDTTAALTETSDPLFAALRDSLPAKITSPAEWSAGELALARLEAQQSQPWPGLDDTGKQRRLDTLRELLAERAAAYLEQRRDAVAALYDSGKDGDSERDRLAAITEKTPLLKRLVALQHTEALAKADAARAAYSVRATLAELPERIKKADSVGALQTLLVAFTKLEQTPGINLTAETVKPVEGAFAAKAIDFAQEYAKKAETAYAANQLKEGDAIQNQLKALSAALPPRFGQAALISLEQSAEAARENAENRAKQAADLAKAQQELAGHLDALAATLPAEGSADAQTILNLFNALAKHNPANIKEQSAKDKLDKLLKRSADSLSALIAQNEPVETRAERLSAAAGCLDVPAAATLLGRQAETLRAQLKKQQGVSVLRLTNKFASPVTVSSVNSAFRQTRLAPEESKLWTIPVPGETLSLSVSIDLGDRNRSRFATLKLPHGGGLIHALGDAAEAAVTATAPPAPAEPAPAVPAPPAGGEAASAAPSAKAHFEISVIPREATVLVDGQPASGLVEVSAGDNHQVSASLKGYKTVEQYYRVKPGETRKIDLLLEKEERRSLFGF
ncbi:MAG: serine/threonine protein kinase [Kiritimatiellae bacterium]|nr:serine/threonine protein kinase [Kiritimatiellia bacterium]